MNSTLNEKGFSLTELMVILVIVALLASVGVPAYLKYSNKSKMVEATTLIQRQLDLWAEKNLLGQDPTNTVAPAGQYIKSIVISSNSVVATLNSSTLSFLASDLAITCTPSVTNNSTTWGCTYPPNKQYTDYFPSSYTCPACS